MKRAGAGVAAAALLFLAAPSRAQEPPAGIAPAASAPAKTVTVDDFDGPLAGWTALKIGLGESFEADAESRVAITGDQALSYSYAITPKTVRVLALARALNLAGMRAVRFRVKTDKPTALVFGLSEAGNITYQTGFYCPAGSWQEVAFNLDELALDNPGKDAGNKLDLDRVQALHLADLGNLLVSLVPTLAGARTLMLDDLVFSALSVAPTTGVVREAAPVSRTLYRVDNFEAPLIRWMPVSLELSDPPKIGLFDAPLSIDAGGALKYAYRRQAKKAQGLLRNLERADLRRATILDLRLRSERDGLFVISVQEKDGSRYQRIVPLTSAEGWSELACALAAFTLADDSSDENDTLDAAEIKEIGISDITALLPEGGKPEEAANTLWLDDVQFTLGGEARQER